MKNIIHTASAGTILIAACATRQPTSVYIAVGDASVVLQGDTGVPRKEDKPPEHNVDAGVDSGTIAQAMRCGLAESTAWQTTQIYSSEAGLELYGLGRRVHYDHNGCPELAFGGKPVGGLISSTGRVHSLHWQDNAWEVTAAPAARPGEGIFLSGASLYSVEGVVRGIDGVNFDGPYNVDYYSDITNASTASRVYSTTTYQSGHWLALDPLDRPVVFYTELDCTSMPGFGCFDGAWSFAQQAGETWHSTRISPTNRPMLNAHSSSDLVFDDAAEPHMMFLWRGDRDQPGAVEYAHHVASGWQTEVLDIVSVNDIQNAGSETDNSRQFSMELAVSPGGLPHMFHVQWLEFEGRFALKHVWLEAGHWNVETVPTDGIDIDSTLLPSAVAEADGQIHLVWRSLRTQEVWYFHRSDEGWSAPESIATELPESEHLTGPNELLKLRVTPEEITVVHVNDAFFPRAERPAGETRTEVYVTSRQRNSHID